jgi:putative lipoic acid-binding regulatory protein
MSKQDDFYDKLKESLEVATDFPSEYLFKFIVPTTKNQLSEVKQVFEMSGAVIRTKNSKTNKYVSISISIKMSKESYLCDSFNNTKAGIRISFGRNRIHN